MEKPSTPNPANVGASNPGSTSTPVETPRRKRIPMNLPTRKLEVEDIPGWRLYWFKEENVPRAIQAGYVFVKDSEVALNRTQIGGAPGVSGNTDMGSGVSIIGGKREDGVPQRLVLMKIEIHFFKEDQLAAVQRNVSIVQGIFDEEQIIAEGADIEDSGRLIYLGEGSSIRARTPLFNRSQRKAKVKRRREFY